MTREQLAGLKRGDTIYSASGKPYRVTGISIGTQVFERGHLVGVVGDEPHAIVYMLRNGREFGAGRGISAERAANWYLSPPANA